MTAVDERRCQLSDLPSWMCAHCLGHTLDPAFENVGLDWADTVDPPPARKREPVGIRLVRPRTCIYCRTRMLAGELVFPDSDGFYACGDCIGDR